MTTQLEAAARQALEALEKCDSALAEELAAWDIDPPLQHVLDASNACDPAITALRSALEQQAAQEPVAWQPIETSPSGKIVLVHYKNMLGNGRTMRARYYLPETLESDTTESGWADEGWYEESEAYEYLMPLDGTPTHWMPLPPAPDAEGEISLCTRPAPQQAAQEPGADAKDAARYRWLKERMLGVDFDWNDNLITALGFEMPDGCAYGGDCDENIDAAMAAHGIQPSP